MRNFKHAKAFASAARRAYAEQHEDLAHLADLQEVA
jgi:hypothetical protein